MTAFHPQTTGAKQVVLAKIKGEVSECQNFEPLHTARIRNFVMLIHSYQLESHTHTMSKVENAVRSESRLDQVSSDRRPSSYQR